MQGHAKIRHSPRLLAPLASEGAHALLSANVPPSRRPASARGAQRTYSAAGRIRCPYDAGVQISGLCAGLGLQPRLAQCCARGERYWQRGSGLFQALAGVRPCRFIKRARPGPAAFPELQPHEYLPRLVWESDCVAASGRLNGQIEATLPNSCVTSTSSVEPLAPGPGLVLCVGSMFQRTTHGRASCLAARPSPPGGDLFLAPPAAAAPTPSSSLSPPSLRCAS